VAYLTFTPTTPELCEQLMDVMDELILVLSSELQKLGVAENDIVIRVERSTRFASVEHIEIVLKTDNPNVTAPAVVSILNQVIDFTNFEVSRIPVGYSVIELLYELVAFIKRKRRNWCGTYEQ
jgi:hypothetical protein